MHDNNRTFLDDLVKKYPDSFRNVKVLELGSGNMGPKTDENLHKLNGRNYGSVRPWFSGCEYIGVDICEGLGVELAMAAKDTKLQENYFDTLISFSLLEHDLEWRLSLGNNLKWLKSGGMIFMCWGAEGNEPHMQVWAIVPHQDVLGFLKENGVEVLDAFFEEDRYGKNCAGAYDLVAKKL